MEELKKWIEESAGCGYVYGATGWVCTQERLDQQAQQYPAQAEKILSVCRKWIGVTCYDCAQLIRQALRTRGIQIPSGCTSQWKADVWAQKGEIGSMPDALCVLYRQEGSVMEHAGWHLGGGVVIDARGSAQGVIRSDVGSYPWTHWATVRGLQAGETKADVPAVQYRAVVSTQKDPLRVRSYPVTGEILGRVPRGRTVDVLDVLENGWVHIRYNELDGYVSAMYLEKEEEQKTVTIPRALAMQLLSALEAALD